MKHNNFPWLRPRYRNDFIRTMEAEYVPISPVTRLPENPDKLHWRFENHQVRILNHVFTKVWKKNESDPLTGNLGRWRLPYRTILYSTIKKSGKTAIAAAAGYATARLVGGEMYSIANDLDQARDRAFTRVDTFLEWWKNTGWKEPKDKKGYDDVIQRRYKDAIEFKDPYALIRAIPCDPGGEAGGFPTLTLWDELWNYTGENVNRLWTEMQPIPNIAESFRFVVTYAGYVGESELLFNLYDTVCCPDPEQPGVYNGQRPEGLEDLPCYILGDTFVYWNHDPRMPWHTPEFLLEARNDPAIKGRQFEYDRLWRNMWTSGLDSFIDMNKVDAITKLGKDVGLTNRLEGV